jgi:hypothetical protein
MWKTIPNFTKYEISTQGRVKHRRLLHILKYSKPSNGYLQVNIYSDVAKYPISKCVHQLMALTFMGERPLGHEVAHLDEIKKHNELTNLAYLHWRKNRKRIHPVKYCIVCGAQTVNICCSRACRWLASRVLVQCTYCKKWFFRRKCTLNAMRPDRGYTRGRIYCSRQCSGLDRRIDKA